MEEENLRGNIPLPDQKKNSESTWTNSYPSDLTVDNTNARPGSSAVWTDEKHRSYLDSIESSFVNNQLRHSFRPREMGVRSCSWRHQFMVFRDGSWKEKKNEPLLESTADSHFIEETTRSMCHFRSAGNNRNARHHDLQGHTASYGGGIHLRENATVSGGLARSSEQHTACCLCYQNSAGSTIEVSDQNYVEEDQEEKSSCGPVAKRSRTPGAEASSNDQVVPFTKSDKRDVSTVSQASSEREEPVHQELLSENPDNFVRQNSLLYFLRGT